MIGNDIVDRAQAKQESNWQRRGFLDKLFTPDEQQLILTASDPECMVWALWTMKESAYKAMIRETGKRVFAPKKLVCQINMINEKMVEGTVFYGNAYQTKSSITHSYIDTVAVLASTPTDLHQNIIQFEKPTYQIQHTRIQEELKKYCSNYLVSSPAENYLQKDQTGVPSLTLIKSSGDRLTIPISISHHGYYGSFAIAGIYGF